MSEKNKPVAMYELRRRGLTIASAVIWFAIGITLIVLDILTLIKFPLDDSAIIVAVSGIFIWAAVMLAIGGLCLRNAFYPYIAIADETGIYDFSGFIHGGFVQWSDVRAITLGSGSVAEDAINALNGDAPCVTVYLKDARAFAAKKPNALKRMLFWLSSGRIKIKTLCARAKKREVYANLSAVAERYLGEGIGNGQG